jgi:hypothetical protein
MDSIESDQPDRVVLVGILADDPTGVIESGAQREDAAPIDERSINRTSSPGSGEVAGLHDQ